MKIRTQFISNSSSTSFSIYGAMINKEQQDIIDDYNDRTFIDTYYGDPNDYPSSNIYIGAEFDACGFNETKQQWMDRVKAEIKKIIPDIKHDAFGFYSESYYDG
jgi:hypothetical protein